MNTETKRPAKNTEENIEAAIDMLFPSVWDWLQSAGDSQYENEEREGVRKDLKKAITSCVGDYDGYKIAKNLDDWCMWECDAQLVDILDSFWHFSDRVHHEAVKQWVQEQSINPQHSIGDNITVKVLDKEYTGVVVGLNPVSATYTVNISELGHKKFSIDAHGGVVFEPGSGSLGVIVGVEEIDGKG